ncbi:hypothetical protein [Nitrosopumilus sp.]|uniref:hypothetical protein n=1 Tax=Nitrosopumilus sp. TaxID=2024843 RepID=UPI0034A054AB
MKRITSIVLFASIFAITVGALGFSGNSATSLMVAAIPQTQENVGMLGHVEYRLFDEMGNVKGYMQNDNIVVEAGKDCAAKALFDSSASVGQCTGSVTNFQWIGIGNGSSATINVTNQTLADSTDDETGTCSQSGGTGTAGGGDMARRSVTPSFNVAGTTAIVTLDTSSAPFTFDAGNATVVRDSGVFNANYGTPGAGSTCGGTNTAGTTWSMFSRQLLNAATGITVSSGDSLSVKWTITVG